VVLEKVYRTRKNCVHGRTNVVSFLVSVSLWERLVVAVAVLVPQPDVLLRFAWNKYKDRKMQIKILIMDGQKLSNELNPGGTKSTIIMHDKNESATQEDSWRLNCWTPCR